MFIFLSDEVRAINYQEKGRTILLALEPTVSALERK